MLLVVFHRAIVRHVSVGQHDRKFVNDSLCTSVFTLQYTFSRESTRVELTLNPPDPQTSRQ